MLAVVTFGFGSEAWAQTAVCSNAPGAQERVSCEEPSTSANDINIDLQNVEISVTDAVSAVEGYHSGTGDIDIRVRKSTLSGSGSANLGGISGLHTNSGDVDIEVRDSTINISGRSSAGILGQVNVSGNVDIEVWDSTITASDSNNGISYYGIRGLNNGSGNVAIRVEGGSITTASDSRYAILAEHGGSSGDIDVDVRNSTVSTKGNLANGIHAYFTGSSNIDIDLEGGRITTGGYVAHGVVAFDPERTNPSALTNNIEITTRNHAIETTGTAHHSSLQGTYSYGLYAYQRSAGNIIIDLGEGSSVTTHGKDSHGIVAYQYGDQETRSMDVTVSGSITTNGEAAQGVRMGTVSSNTPARMAGLDSEGYRRQTVTVNGSITSAGEGVYLANGGRVTIGPEGRIRSGSGIAILATGTVLAANTDPAIPPKLRVDFNLDGRQRVADAIGDDWILNDGGETTIAVNSIVLHDGSTGVTGATAANGVWDVTMLADGLTVTDRSTDPWTISARDSLTIADRDFSASDFNEVTEPEPTEPEPQVHRVDEPVSAGPDAVAGVHVEGDGEVYIGAQGRIEAASGIAILATGDAPDLLVDITLDERRVAEVIGDDWIINDGGGTTIVVNDVKLHDGTTGVVPDALAPNGAFDVRIRAEGVRVLDHTDPDPANWEISDLAAGIIADRDFSVADFIETRKEPEPTQPVFMEEYAPRAALYESLPGLLLRLDAGTPVRRPEQPAWAQVGYGTGRGEADHSETGASYDFDRIEAAAGISRAWGDNLGGSVWLRRLQSEVKVDMPAGSGELELHGVGAGVQGHWREADGLYVSGALSWTDFDVDASSEKRGRLAKDVGADLWQARLEAGYLIAQGGGLTLRPRAWAWHAEADIDGFTDAVEAQVSGVDESRSAAGLGLLAELAQSESSLYGSVDVENVFAGEETVVRVSGQALESESERTRVWLGVGGQQQGKRVALRGGLRLADPGGRNQEVSASVSVSGNF